MTSTLPFISAAELKRTGMRRECGGCTACCYVIQVWAVGKPFRTKCPYVVEGQGCGIWSGPGGPGGPGGQPQTCSTYRCAWAMGFGEMKDRPDKTGILVDFRVPSTVDLDAQPAFYAIGIDAGDEDDPRAVVAMRNIARDSGWPVHLADQMMNVREVIGGDEDGCSSR